MPSPRAELRARRGWNAHHWGQLLTGRDWSLVGPTRGAWGNIYELKGDELVETVAEMLACWKQQRHLVTPEHAGLNDLGHRPWFEQYADNPQLLIDEILKYQAYMQYQSDHNGYRPYSEFEQQYNPAAAAPADAETT